MDIQGLMNDWTKYNSLCFLKERGINTPNFRLVRDIPSLEPELLNNWDKKVSIRTFRPDKNKAILGVHLPNVPVGVVIESKCYELLEEGFYLIFSDPIDPLDCVTRGNIAYYFENEWLMEYAEGPGTVREIESLPSVSIKRISEQPFNRTIPRARDKVYQELNLKGLFVVSIIESIYWGTPILLEWSIYSRPVGFSERELIFWELRRA